MDASFLELPAQIQIALASGYAAYMASTYGARTHHSATDTTLRSLAYGLIASGILAIMPEQSSLVLGGIIAFAVTILIGLLWRTRLCKVWNRLMRESEITFSDDSPSAWALMGSNSDYYVSQVSVTLDDGTTLICDQLSKFSDAPFGPCVLGSNGDLALYVTLIKNTRGTREQVGVRDSTFGDRITWIPADRIRKMTIRHQKK